MIKIKTSWILIVLLSSGGPIELNPLLLQVKVQVETADDNSHDGHPKANLMEVVDRGQDQFEDAQREARYGYQDMLVTFVRLATATHS